MQKTWNILYRGDLSSCNYSCDYCPFAKTKNTKEELEIDAGQVRKFQNWISGRKERIGILFTPWGEALIRKYYQQTMTQLSHMKHVYRVAMQTNLSCHLEWMHEVNKDTFALWTTFHPSQTSVDAFLAKCEALLNMGIRFSVGTVGLKEDLETIRLLREKLPTSVYLWVNAYKSGTDYYTQGEIKFIEFIDPLFHWNNQRHESLGKPCRAGETTFSIDGMGNVTSCHFISRKLGNIYENSIENILKPSTCVKETCSCHIGYVHMKELEQDEIYGNGLLERIPIRFH
ncbi:STM4011 family radical SAM protein [Aureibacter tunicatorum]|uniref:MoaA/NifB/PqqE/SkfB family radical SAM enzyme n=1 Tax=Aureibacter tunicatorum TaxID=866807 RepID=A0AAE3XNQ8_9BACT|nr:STM4011 family radical SAM protein [Aureibacter tunicatorum]MDR6239870.1 MoaA/NifB/PqqE/SkfB family radical SAM enzyme [Aureibacter tunicatorum]BDD04345.1 hypothetical protein AUTU_18280 [Aureibacter tunicatorum]